MGSTIKFINENLRIIEDSENIPNEFDQFIEFEKSKAIKLLSKEENLDAQKLEIIIGNYW